jgi:CDGSH-type Zn-finger protein
MSTPIIAQTAPYRIAVEEGKSYYWCACGGSKNQPLCDGSHKGTEFTPVAYTADRTGDVAMCGCKTTGTAPLCDGTHKRI